MKKRARQSEVLILTLDELRKATMRIRYYTDKGSVYIQTVSGDNEYWTKEDTAGEVHPLAGGIHIARSRLRELIREYPTTLLDKTLCFGMGAEKEFFEDAQRERFSGLFEAEPTVIFFLVKHAGDTYGLGCSSEVVRIEKDEEGIDQ